jgi:hypothetical protein
MKVLPDRTSPAPRAVERRHTPPRGAYPTYRACLRWEFGFTCAFCLTHESDLVEHGAEATGLMSIEHHLPQSHDRAGAHADEYANCFYACRFCNRARGALPVVDAHERRLLDPCRDAWGDHFIAIDDRLAPCANDGDAAYTHRAYDLDDPRKQQMRRTRREVLEEAFSLLEGGPPRLLRLLDIAAQAPAPYRAELLDAAQRLRELMTRARRDVERFSAVPADADPRCRCATTEACVLPPFLDAQSRAYPAR